MLDGQNAVVDITPKALEILCILVKNGGRVVTKEEILKSVWADSFVEEANLSHHIFRLRKALCEDETRKFIETVPKRGYRFVDEVNKAPGSDTGPAVQSSRFANQRDRTLYHSAVIISGALLISLAGVLAFSWFNRAAATAGEKVQTPRQNAPNTMNLARVTSSGKKGAGSISPDGKFIAYVQNSFDGEGMLYVRQVDTNSELKLLAPSDRDFGATAFSPDGKYIYYVTNNHDDPKGALYRISVLGGVPVRLVENFGPMFTLSPDGLNVCFYRRDNERQEQSLIIAPLDGGGEQAVLVRPFSEFNFSGAPAWSPDGRQIAYATYNERIPNSAYDVKLSAIELDSRKTHQLTDEVWSEIGKMNWLADGSGLVFAGTRPKSGIQIYYLPYPTGELRQITNGLSSYGNYGLGVTADGTTLVADVWESSAQIWSIAANGEARDAVQLTSGEGDGSAGMASLPDGQIVYSSRTGFDYDLWALRDEAGKREGKPLTSDEFFEGDVAAKGQYLVFASDRAGGQHLFRTDRTGANLRQLTFGESSDAKPDISPDGNWVVYASSLNHQARIWKVSIEGGTPAQLTDFDSIAPAVSPDGEMVSCVSPSLAAANPARLDIVSFVTGAIVRSFDVIPFDYNYRQPRWTPSGDGLVYRKTEKNTGNLWKQNLAGGGPRPFTNFRSDIIFGFIFTDDGKHLIVSRGKRAVNIVMIKNFR